MKYSLKVYMKIENAKENILHMYMEKTKIPMEKKNTNTN